MHKIISWFIIMFISLVSLGAFFDTKQPPKPNMEQSFMEQEKRATNPSQCGESCDLEFASLKNTKLIHHGDYWLDISESGFTWPSDVELQYPNRFRLFGYKNWISAFNFYKKNGTLQSFNTPSSGFKTDIYTISEIVNVKITIGLVDKLHDFKHYITSFSAEMPPLPEKDNEQSLPTAITKNDGEYQYNQFQDKLDYLMVQRRDFDKFNYSYLYWVPIFNFFDDNFKYMSEMSIELNGFKQNSKFTLIRSFEPENSLYFFDSLEFSSFSDVFCTIAQTYVSFKRFLKVYLKNWMGCLLLFNDSFGSYKSNNIHLNIFVIH